MTGLSRTPTADPCAGAGHPRALLALVALQTLVTAAPLALLPFLGLQVAVMSDAPASWTALEIGRAHV
ncbi:hypothetical protein GCM10007887_43360 [Methylobacterium haplocladii]|nr:hypothetical protein [Methylobacterium haplocladii]GLS61598.1 hypothetical protein GCM10007887_43360 [Methylobacterium haplocladii]